MRYHRPTVDKDARPEDLLRRRCKHQPSPASVTDAIAAGDKKTISMPAGGARPAAGATAAAAEAPKEEDKKEEAEDVDMGGLFGDDDEYS